MWFTPAKTADGRGNAKQPYAALVVYVHDERHVNLVVFDHIARPHPRLNVQLLQDDDVPKDPAGEGTAAWMPYQAAAAKQYPVELPVVSAPVETTDPGSGDTGEAAATAGAAPV